MELWIRSQDKEVLMKVCDIALKKEAIIGYFDKETEYEYLGMYKTKERALEVLEEIQNILKPQIITKLGKPIGKTCDGTIYREPDEFEIKELSTYVYEMPIE